MIIGYTLCVFQQCFNNILLVSCICGGSRKYCNELPSGSRNHILLVIGTDYKGWCKSYSLYAEYGCWQLWL